MKTLWVLVIDVNVGIVVLILDYPSTSSSHLPLRSEV